MVLCINEMQKGSCRTWKIFFPVRATYVYVCRTDPIRATYVYVCCTDLGVE